MEGFGKEDWGREAYFDFLDLAFKTTDVTVAFCGGFFEFHDRYERVDIVCKNSNNSDALQFSHYTDRN